MKQYFCLITQREAVFLFDYTTWRLFTIWSGLYYYYVFTRLLCSFLFLVNSSSKFLLVSKFWTRIKEFSEKKYFQYFFLPGEGESVISLTVISGRLAFGYTRYWHVLVQVILLLEFEWSQFCRSFVPCLSCWLMFTCVATVVVHVDLFQDSSHVKTWLKKQKGLCPIKV